MVRILPNGDIVRDDDPRARRAAAREGAFGFARNNKAGLVFMAFLVFLVFKNRSNPFANGPVPAAARLPSEHWDTIKGWGTFVRDFTAFSNGVGSRRAGLSTMIFGASGGPKKLDWQGESGGIDGHEPEMMDLDKQDPTTVTRCTSTRFAVTAYYCGLDVAQNLDQDKRESTNATSFQGVAPLDKFIALMHDLVPRAPMVYRLGIGSKKHATPGQSHVWSIVANPDGTYHWLQSFIEHYSLHEWMKLSESRGERNLTLKGLRKKLKALGTLTDIDAWTPEANSIYAELFNVDILKIVGNARHSWNKDDHLMELAWDPACEYPLPNEQEAEGEL